MTPSERRAFLASIATEDAQMRREVTAGRERVIASFHEAGHAVVGDHLGIVVTGLTIAPIQSADSGCDLGRCYYEPPGRWRCDLEREAIATAAGYAAGRLAPPDEVRPYPRPGHAAAVVAAVEAMVPPTRQSWRWPEPAEVTGDECILWEIMEEIHGIHRSGVIAAHLGLVTEEATALVTELAPRIKGVADRLLISEELDYAAVQATLRAPG